MLGGVVGAVATGRGVVRPHRVAEGAPQRGVHLILKGHHPPRLERPLCDLEVPVRELEPEQRLQLPLPGFVGGEARGGGRRARRRARDVQE